MNSSSEIETIRSEAIQKTFHLLATTPNTCAEATLIAALGSQSGEIVVASAKALLVRQSELGKEAIASRWPELQRFLTPLFAYYPGRMTECLAKRLDPDNIASARLACQIAVDIAEYDLIPKLLTHVENRRSPLCGETQATLSALVQLLYDETHGRRSYEKKRDPQLARARVVSELENSLVRFCQHRNLTILTCFLMLAGHDHAQVARLLCLADAASPLSQETVKLLTSSRSPGLMRLLANYLDDPSPPIAALQIAAQRVDQPFVDECLRRIDHGDRALLAQNLKRVSDWRWLDLDDAVWKSLYESEQAAAVTWAVLSGIPIPKKLAILTWVLKHGRIGARIRAAESLAEFEGKPTDSLVLEYLGDADARVRAAMISQLRDRELPGAVARLIAALEDQDPLVRKAAQKNLPEFRFRRYADLFDAMEPSLQRTNGLIVKRADEDWRAQLEAELRSETRLRRLRGLRMANRMQAGNDVLPAIIPFLQEEDSLARHEAVSVLSQSSAPEAIEALRQCLLDRHPTVRSAAEEALRQRAATLNLAAPPIAPAAEPFAMSFSTPSRA